MVLFLPPAYLIKVFKLDLKHKSLLKPGLCICVSVSGRFELFPRSNLERWQSYFFGVPAKYFISIPTFAGNLCISFERSCVKMVRVIVCLAFVLSCGWLFGGCVLCSFRLFVYTYFRAYIHLRFKHAVPAHTSAVWAVV